MIIPMANITIYLPEEVFERYRKDKKRRGVIAKLIAEYYGLTIRESRVVRKGSLLPPTAPHLAPPLIEKYKK